MLSLAQGASEHIRDYVHQVEKLSWKIPKEMVSLFAIAFVKGMRDLELKQRVTFDFKDSPNFSFLKALTVVKFSFQEIGEPDPFCPDHQSHNVLPTSVPLYTASAISQVNTISKADIVQLPSGNIQQAPALTQEQFHTFMFAYEAMVGRVPRQPYIPAASGLTNHRGNPRGSPRVTCFNSRIRGHYADTCTNRSLSAFEQQEIRERIRQEREANHSDYSPIGNQQEVPLTGANSTEIVKRTVLPHSNSKRRTTGAIV